MSVMARGREMFKAGTILIFAVLLTAAAPMPTPKPAQDAPTSAAQTVTVPVVGSSMDHRVYVDARCEHGCGYTENERGFLQKLWTDPVAMFTMVLALSTIGLWIVTFIAARNARRGLTEIERAFVFMDRFNIAVQLDINTKLHRSWSFTPVWKNSGTTPTKRMYCHVSINVFDEDIPPNYLFPDLWDEGKSPSNPIVLIGPKGEASVLDVKHEPERPAARDGSLR